MSEAIKTVEIVRILPTRIWIENDIHGARHVMLQHEGMHAFTYASFHYSYGYTDNAGTWAAAKDLAIALGATEPIECRHRGWPEAEAAMAAASLGEPQQTQRECCNADCGWTGQTDRMLGAVGPLCPDCGEVTEPVTPPVGQERPE